MDTATQAHSAERSTGAEFQNKLAQVPQDLRHFHEQDDMASMGDRLFDLLKFLLAGVTGIAVAFLAALAALGIAS